jgi:butyrate kinase
MIRSLGSTEQTLKDSILCTGAALIVLASTAAPAHAQEAARRVATKASAVADKTARVVKHGVDKASSAVQHGGKKTSEAVHRAGKTVGVPTTPASATPPPQTSK